MKKKGTLPSDTGGSISKFIFIFLGIMAIMMMFDYNLRMGFASMLDYVLGPLRFGNQYPMLTLFCASLIMVTFSTIVRNYFTDWMEAARTSKIMKAFQKEFREARLSNNTYKIKKLTEVQREIMGMSSKNMKASLKAMAVTMFLILAIFTWIWLFVASLPNSSFSVPWALNLSLMDSIVLPYWIILYSLMAIPIGQLLGRVLKHFSFKKRLKKLEE